MAAEELPLSRAPLAAALGARVCAVCGKCTYDTRRSFVTMVGCSPQAFGRWFDREMGGAVVTIWTAMDMVRCVMDGWGVGGIVAIFAVSSTAVRASARHRG